MTFVSLNDLLRDSVPEAKPPVALGTSRHSQKVEVAGRAAWVADLLCQGH